MVPFGVVWLGHMLSVGAICFEDRFCASKKDGIVGGGRVSARGAMCKAAGLGQHWLDHFSSSPCEDPFSGIESSFQLGGAFTDWRTLTLETR